MSKPDRRVSSAVLQSLPSSLLLLGFGLWVYWLTPHKAVEGWKQGLLALGLVGSFRYLWLLLNQLRAARYLRYHFPRLRAEVSALGLQYPKRLYIIVPSYREDPLVTRRSVTALAHETATLPSEVHVLFSVATTEEMELIHALMRRHGRTERLEISFLLQKDGKRMALGQALRATSREFFRVADWHSDAHNDIVVLMDGDTELQSGSLRKCLGFFRLLPDLGALTTDEEAHMIGKEVEKSALKPWFDLKFAKRHTMMSSHALSGRVLTLTGRFSVFRAAPILDHGFITRVESDYVYHWVFGRFKLLMGDDKSTWFDLLSHGWRMLYVPDVRINCLETRGGHFLEVSRGLMFRWFGNMARNNTRAVQLGPRRMPFFIWLCLLDQRVSMWTSLIGPCVAVFGSFLLGWSVILLYGVWILLTRLCYLWLLVPRGFVLKPVHVFLQIYDQWLGSVTKIAASMMQHRQSWSKAKNSKQIDMNLGEGYALRNRVAWLRLVLSALIFVVSMLVFAGVIRLPGQLHLFSLAHAETPSLTVHAEDFDVIPDDGKDDAVALQALLDRVDVRSIILPAGRLDLDRPLRLWQSHTALLGQGRDRTRLVARWDNKGHLAEQAILQLQGQKIRRIGELQAPLRAGARQFSVRLLPRESLVEQAWVHFEVDNSPAFLDELKAKNWRQLRPPLRQWIGQFAATETQEPILQQPVLIDLPAGTQLNLIRPLEKVRLEGFSLELEIPGGQIAEQRYKYENTFPEHVIDGLRLDWVTQTSIRDIEILAAGRHPLVLENTAEIIAENVRVDGAWNKGKGGSGYVRVARSYLSMLTGFDVANIRHVTFQWSAAGNVLENSRLAVDVNFHGGYASHNHVRSTRFVLPAQHPWGRVTRTPDNARWAPPDGPGNVVD